MKLNRALKNAVGLIITFVFLQSCTTSQNQKEGSESLRLVQNDKGGTIAVFRKDGKDALVTQNAKADFRPFLHPIMSPDGKSELTEYSPGHHKHQTGLYWGFTRVNGSGAPKDTVKKYFYQKDDLPEMQEKIGRDFFHHPEGDHWRRVSLDILKEKGEEVSWQTVYDMLGKDGEPIMQETQIWTMKEKAGQFLLNLEWQGKAITDITIGEFDYGGLFLRMPWKEGMKGQAVNAARQKMKKQKVREPCGWM